MYDKAIPILYRYNILHCMSYLIYSINVNNTKRLPFHAKPLHYIIAVFDYVTLHF